MTDAKLHYTAPRDTVVLPTDVLHVHAGQSTVMVECKECSWMSQPFVFAARKVHLTLRTHFLGHLVDGKIKSWRCNQRP